LNEAHRHTVEPPTGPGAGDESEIRLWVLALAGSTS
jgi:hypothetical protein